MERRRRLDALVGGSGGDSFFEAALVADRGSTGGTTSTSLTSGAYHQNFHPSQPAPPRLNEPAPPPQQQSRRQSPSKGVNGIFSSSSSSSSLSSPSLQLGELHLFRPSSSEFIWDKMSPAQLNQLLGDGCFYDTHPASIATSFSSRGGVAAAGANPSP